jgi:hypothetical protein
MYARGSAEPADEADRGRHPGSQSYCFDPWLQPGRALVSTFYG